MFPRLLLQIVFCIVRKSPTIRSLVSSLLIFIDCSETFLREVFALTAVTNRYVMTWKESAKSEVLTMFREIPGHFNRRIVLLEFLLFFFNNHTAKLLSVETVLQHRLREPFIRFDTGHTTCLNDGVLPYFRQLPDNLSLIGELHFPVFSVSSAGFLPCQQNTTFGNDVAKIDQLRYSSCCYIFHFYCNFFPFHMTD